MAPGPTLHGMPARIELACLCSRSRFCSQFGYLAGPVINLHNIFSSALGVFVLGVAYLRWQRSKSRLCDADDGFERWRWRLIVGSAAAAILLGLLHALTLANAAPIALFWRVLMFQFAIRTTSTFTILIVLCAMVLFWRIKRAHFGRPPGPKSSI